MNFKKSFAYTVCFVLIFITTILFFQACDDLENQCVSGDTCSEHADCCGSFVCDDGVCTAQDNLSQNNENEECEDNFDCETGKKCDTVSKKCIEGDNCTNDSDCKDDATCDTQTGNCIEKIACFENSDCAASLQVCVNRSCVDIGTICQDNSHCYENQVCSNDGNCIGKDEERSCENHQDCIDGESCVNGICLDEDDVVTRSCVNHQDCQEGESCVNGICVDEGDISPRTCENHQDCESGESCIEGICVAPGGIGYLCSGDHECNDDLACINNRCADYNGAVPCQSNAECPLNQVCHENFCQTRPPLNSQIGEPCLEDVDCVDNGKCLLEVFNNEESGFIGGYCTKYGCNADNNTGCPSGSDCYLLGQNNDNQPVTACLDECSNLSDCRSGYACVPSEYSNGACLPKCTASSCAAGTNCNEETGVCDSAVGRPCNSVEPCPSGWTCLSDSAGWWGGYCTVGCNSSSCPAGSVCASIGVDEKACFDFCTSTNNCRNDYYCQPDDTSNDAACLPLCRGDENCQEGTYCNEHGQCVG